MFLKSRCWISGIFAVVLLFTMIIDVSAEATVVARVGSVPITEFELGRELQKLVPLASSFHSGIAPEKIEELKVKALNKLIEKAYMVQYALNEEIVVSSEEIDAVFLPTRDQFPSEKEFKKALGKESVGEFRAAIYRKLLADKALNVAVNQKVSVSDDAIKSDYEKNKHRFMRPRQYRASQILVKVDPSSNAEEKAERLKRANDLAEKAKAGADFYDLAYYNSDDRTKFVGGDIGTFHQGQIMKEVEDVILKMKVGEVSDPIQILQGFIIIKLFEDNPPKQLSYEEMRAKLTEAEKKKQYEALKTEWLEQLKGKYKVERIAP